MSDMSMLINGLKVSAENNATFERRNPLDGTVATRAPAASPADAILAVEAAAEAFKTWCDVFNARQSYTLIFWNLKQTTFTPKLLFIASYYLLIP